MDLKIENLFKLIEIIEKKLDEFEKRIGKIESKLNLGTTIKEDEIKQNENKASNENKFNIEGSKITDFINFYSLEKLGYDNFSAKDIEKENEAINTLIQERAYDFLPNNEKEENEIVGEFLYSIGGISRTSQLIANIIFRDLFEIYKNYLKEKNTYLKFNHESDRKMFSIWAKKSIHESKFYEYISLSNKKKIEKYLLNKDNNTKEFLLKIYQDLISLYLKCRLSFPIVDCKYTYDSKFDPYLMLDIIDKSGKNKKVNFCYLPELKSNGKVLKNGKFLVFTYIKEKTYKKKIKDNVFEEFEKKEKIEYPQLYILPDFKEFKYEANNNILKVISPNIDYSEFYPNYKLHLIPNPDTLYILQSKNGCFSLNEIYKYNCQFFQFEIYFFNILVYKSPKFPFKK